MEIVGFAYSHADPPLDTGYIELRELNVTLGPNDAGKSSLLRLMSQAMAAEPDSLTANCRFFMRVRPDERDVLLAHAAGDLLRRVADFPEPHLLSNHGGWDQAKLDKIASLPLENASLTLLAALREVAPEPTAAWDVVLSELASSDLFEFEPFRERDVYEERRRWRLNWCLAPVATLDPTVRAVLPALGMSQPVWDRLLESRTGVRHGEAPVPVAPAGILDLPITPVPISVPRDFSEIQGSAQDAVRALAEHSMYALTERVESLGDLVGSSRLKGPASLLRPSPDQRSAAIDDGVFAACRFLAEAVQKRLPRFIREDYSVDVAVLPIGAWADDRYLALNLIDRSSETSFPVEGVADGHRLWLQLALLEGINATDRLRLTLERRLELDVPGLEDAYWEVREEMPDPELIVDGSEVARRGGRTAYLAALEEFYAGTLGPVEISLAELVTEMETQMTDWAMAATMTRAPGVELLEPSRGRFYFIDEPERHLHPRIQREAATWLADLVRVGSAQAVVATHSVPFINLGPETSLVYVDRTKGGPTRSQTIDSVALDALSVEARTLGLNRGELLATKSVFLYVEGLADQAALEALFPEELTGAGIAVVPMHGYSRGSEIPEAETLMRFTSARAAVWLDKVRREVVERLKNDETFAQQVRSQKKSFSDEERSLAELMLAARRTNREVEPLPNPGADVFDLLDETVIQTYFPSFPGHAEAYRMAEAAGASSGKQKKRYYAQHFGIEIDPNTVTRIASKMREQGRVPQPLREVMEICERLSLEVT